MTYKKLCEVQQALDDIINDTNGIESGEKMMDERILALMVEIGEFANETRCFKFWSQKEPSKKEIVLSEFVDVLHFMLSIGNYSGLAFQSFEEMDINRYIEDDISNLFIDFYGAVITFRFTPSPNNYTVLYDYFFSIATQFNFTDKEIIDAYFMKNEININRQADGY